MPELPHECLGKNIIRNESTFSVFTGFFFSKFSQYILVLSFARMKLNTNSFGILHDTSYEWFKPALQDFHVTIQKQEYLPFRGFSSYHSASYQPFPDWLGQVGKLGCGIW